MRRSEPSGPSSPTLTERFRIDLDIQKYTDPGHSPMIPNTLVLKPGLVIHRIYNGYWFWGRPSTADLSLATWRYSGSTPRGDIAGARRPDLSFDGFEQLTRVINLSSLHDHPDIARILDVFQWIAGRDV